MRELLLIALSLTVIAFVSCGDYSCDPGDTRCSVDVSQLCNADNEWVDFEHCGRIDKHCECSGREFVSCCE